MLNKTPSVVANEPVLVPVEAAEVDVLDAVELEIFVELVVTAADLEVVDNVTTGVCEEATCAFTLALPLSLPQLLFLCSRPKASGPARNSRG